MGINYTPTHIMMFLEVRSLLFYRHLQVINLYVLFYFFYLYQIWSVAAAYCMLGNPRIPWVMGPDASHSQGHSSWDDKILIQILLVCYIDITVINYRKYVTMIRFITAPLYYRYCKTATSPQWIYARHNNSRSWYKGKNHWSSITVVTSINCLLNEQMNGLWRDDIAWSADCIEFTTVGGRFLVRHTHFLK